MNHLGDKNLNVSLWRQIYFYSVLRTMLSSKALEKYQIIDTQSVIIILHHNVVPVMNVTRQFEAADTAVLGGLV